MKFYSRKLFALLTIIALLAGPVSVAAQAVEGDVGYTEGQDYTPITFPQVNVQELGPLGQGGGGLQQILGDRTACEAEAPKAKDPTSAIGQGLAQGVAESAIEAIKQGLPENMISYVQSDLPQRLTNNLQNKLGPEFANRLEAELMSGLDPADITDAMVEQIMRDSIDAVIKGSVQESVQDSIPRAIGQSVTEGIGVNLNENIRSSIRYSTEGPFRNVLNGLLTGSGNVGEGLINGILDNMSNQLGNALMGQLEGSMDEIVSSVTDGVMGSLDSSLNQITGDLTGSIDEIIGTLDGSLQDITNSLTDALTDPIAGLTDNLTGSIDDIVDSLNGPLQELTGSFDDITDDLVSSITGPINGLTDQITGSIDKFTSQITDSITSPINDIVDQASGVIDSTVGAAIKPLENLAGGIIQKPADMVGQFTTGLVSKIPGIGGLAGGLLSSSVPVHEVGDLLQVTKDIKDIESESRDVLIEICGHIKDVRRIQLAFEQKEFVQDAQARQAASDEVEKYNEAYLKFVNEGYAVDGSGQKRSLVIEDFGDLLMARRGETAELVIKEGLEKSSDIFKEATSEILARQEAESRQYPASSISKADYDKLKSDSNLPSNELTKLLIKVFDPSKPNNPHTSYLINNQVLQRAKDRAEELAILESQSSGFNPVRECIKVASDGKNCLDWRIITPGSIIQENVGNVFDSRLEQLEQADEVTDIGEDTPIPTPAQSETFETDDATAGGSPGFNGNFAQNIFSGLLARLRGIFNNGGNGGGGGTGEEGEPPVVNLTFTTPTISQINGGQANAAFINLSTQGADKCVAASNWYGLKSSGNKVEVAIAQGAEVGTSGSLKISLPLNFSLRMERVRGDEVTTFTPATTVNTSLTQQVSNLNFGNSQVAAGDTFKLIVKSINQEQMVSITATSANAAAVVTALQQAVLSLGASTDQGKEFKPLRLTFNSNQSGEGFITATIEPTYRLTCSNSEGSTNASVTITR